MNRKRSRYGLKHDAGREAGDYVANGMLIAAALVLGFSAERTSTPARRKPTSTSPRGRPHSRRGPPATVMIGIIISSVVMPMPARRRRCRRRSSPRRQSARRTCRRAGR
jgi:hypothetical protein